MSNAFKCDACGKFFKIKGTYDSEGATLKGDGIMPRLKEYWYPLSVDVCPECSKPLKEFLPVWWKQITTKSRTEE